MTHKPPRLQHPRNSLYAPCGPPHAEYHTAQRDAKERYKARTGILPPSQPTSTYTNTPFYADIGPTIARLQYERALPCPRWPESSQTTPLRPCLNSPCRANMTPGEPYRRWFHDHISRQHYSLGEATDYYYTTGSEIQNMAPHPLPVTTPTTAPQPHRPLTSNNAPPPQAHSLPSDQEPNNTSHNPATHNHARAQIIVEDIHTSPDDANAVLNSGAMMTTAPRRLLTINPDWEVNIRPASPSRDSHPLRKHGDRACRGGIPHRLLPTFHRAKSLPHSPSLCTRHCFRRPRGHIHKH